MKNYVALLLILAFSYSSVCCHGFYGIEEVEVEIQLAGKR
jgi:hypothetical protein